MSRSHGDTTIAPRQGPLAASATGMDVVSEDMLRDTPEAVTAGDWLRRVRLQADVSGPRRSD